jgi:hypothetical protein
MMTMHSPGRASLAVDDDPTLPALPALLVDVEALDDPEPEWIDTEGPLPPMLVEPLSPPGPVLIVVEFEGAALFDRDDLFDDLCEVVPFSATRHGLLLSMTIVVPPLLPVTIETFAPPPLVLVVLSAKAAGARASTAPAITVVAKRARIVRPPMGRFRSVNAHNPRLTAAEPVRGPFSVARHARPGARLARPRRRGLVRRRAAAAVPPPPSPHGSPPAYI